MTTDLSTIEKPFRQLTAQEFIDILTKVDKNKYSEFYRVDNYAGESIVINAVEIIQGCVALDNLKVNLPLYIWNSTFNKGFTISKGLLVHFKIQGCTFNYLRIEDCTFDSLDISSCTFNGSVSLEKVVSNYGFKIWSGIFSDDIRINGGNFAGGFDIYDGTFSKKFTIENAIFFGGFRIWSGAFNSSFETWGSTFSEDFGIGGGSFMGDFLIKSGIFNQDIWLEGGTFYKEIILQNAHIYRLRISHLTSVIRFQIDDTCQIELLQRGNFVV